MASWFEKNIGRPVKDVLRGSRAVAMDQAEANAKQQQVALGVALGRAMSKSLHEIEKSISDFLKEGKVKDLAPIENFPLVGDSAPIVDIDTDYGKRYLTVIIVVAVVYFFAKDFKKLLKVVKNGK